MKQARLDQLADGIFAIVMTLLVLEIRVPGLGAAATNAELLVGLATQLPLLLSYLLSFLLLFTYWRGHHYIASVLAHNIDSTLTLINAIFFLFVGLVPFTSLLLGTYHFAEAAIAVYGINIIVIGLVLYWMRQYVLSSRSIETEAASSVELQHGTIRILFPVLAAAAAIALSFWNTSVSLFLFTLAILFNLSGRSTTLVARLFPNVWKK